MAIFTTKTRSVVEDTIDLSMQKGYRFHLYTYLVGENHVFVLIRGCKVNLYCIQYKLINLYHI